MMEINIKKNIKFLDGKNLSTGFKSISLLHTVKAHSFYTAKKYNFFFIISKIFKKIFIDQTKYFIFLVQNFLTKKNIGNLKGEIILISHCVNSKQSEKYDTYFGNFEKILKKENFSYVKLLINHTRLPSSILNSKKKKTNEIFIEEYLNLFGELKILYIKFEAVIDILILLLNQKINLKISKNLFFSLFDSQTTFSIRLNLQIKNFIKRLNPKFVILTYEGFSWERMCINAIKKFDKNIKCIGYQHTILSDDHYAVYRKIKGEYNPDFIWSSHRSSFKYLKKKSQIKKSKIIFVGNFKERKKIKINNLSRKKILVIPEGIYTECNLLFKLTLDIARKYKNFEFIWRLHPVIDIKKVYSILKIKNEDLPRNITISNNNLEKDSRKALFVIYRGSAAVLTAVLNRCLPLFYEVNLNNFDPLIKIFNKKNYFKSKKDLFRLMKNNHYSKKNLKSKIKKIEEDFFSPINKSNILKTLS